MHTFNLFLIQFMKSKFDTKYNIHVLYYIYIISYIEYHIYI